MTGIVISDHWTIPDEQMQWSFARSSGPGGQNVNKVNSKATLRWKPDMETLVPGGLTQAAWNRFQRQAQRYLTAQGEIVIQSQEHRDQAQNIAACRQKLQTLLIAAMVAPKRRVATRPTKASRQRRLDTKQRTSDKKKSRQPKDFG